MHNPKRTKNGRQRSDRKITKDAKNRTVQPKTHTAEIAKMRFSAKTAAVLDVTQKGQTNHESFAFLGHRIHAKTSNSRRATGCSARAAGPGLNTERGSSGHALQGGRSPMDVQRDGGYSRRLRGGRDRWVLWPLKLMGISHEGVTLAKVQQPLRTLPTPSL